MMVKFTFEYWIDDGWYVGRLREVPGVFSQGAMMQELEANIRDAYRLMDQHCHWIEGERDDGRHPVFNQ